MARPRKATSVLKIQGTERKHRARHPVQPDGTPEMPDWLDTEARAWWDRTVPQLVTLKVATALDADSLAACARWWSVWRKLDKKAAMTGTSRAATAFKQYSTLAGKFGLTPSDREKIASKTPAKEDNPLVELMKVS